MALSLISRDQTSFKLQKNNEVEKGFSGRGALATSLIIVGLSLAVLGAGLAFTATGLAIVATIAMGASGYGAPGIVPGICLTVLFGGIGVACSALTVYLFRKL